jgi:hypothetical protein
MRHTGPGFILAMFLSAGAAAQGLSAQSVDVDRLGPQVGDLVPNFSAVDQNGRTQSLESILGPEGAMLVFNRSARW